MNAIDFIRESAAYMVADRPDVYDQETAVEELSTAIDSLREDEDSIFECVMFTSYMLARIYDDGIEEFILTRKLSSLLLCEEEEDVRAYALTEDFMGLPYVLDEGLDDDGNV